MLKVETAVLSVSDKTNLVEFAQFLEKHKVKLISTGGTARALGDGGLDVVPITAITGNDKDDYFDGRMKTISFNYESALLYDRNNPEHVKQAAKLGIPKVDMVVCNLYPFEETVKKEGVTLEDAVANIDIGGPCMIRAAAKNADNIAIVVSPDSYKEIMEDMDKNDGCISRELLRRLRVEAFARTADYDAAIHTFFSKQHEDENVKRLSYTKGEQLGRYAENWHQKGWIYRDENFEGPNVPAARQVHGGPLGYNNYLDAEAALASVLEINHHTAVSIIKHLNPCGFATGDTLSMAFERAWQGDPVSAFGSVIAMTRPFDLDTAKLIQDRFVEIILAPSIEPEALELIQSLGKKKAGLRLLEYGNPEDADKILNNNSMRFIRGGLLEQEADNKYYLCDSPSQLFEPLADFNCENSGKTLKVGLACGKEIKNREGLCDFVLRHLKHVKSNAICIAREYQTECYQILGMGCGQPNRKDSVEIAGRRATDLLKLEFFSSYEVQPTYSGNPNRSDYVEWLKNKAPEGDYEDYLSSEEAYICDVFESDKVVLASDAFFPFRDGLDNVAEVGIKFVVEPGGSVKDNEVIAAAEEHGITLVFTGVRKFNH